MTKLQVDAAVPLYQQLCDSLKDKIMNGVYKVGDRIPSEEQLVTDYCVSRITVRNAVKILCDEHVLIKRHGKGTYVGAPVIIESTQAGNSFTESCNQIGAVPNTKLISNSLKKAPSNIAKILDVNEGDNVICIKRLRSVNHTATIFEIDYFRPEFEFLLGNLEDGSLLELVRNKTGMDTSKFEDTFDVFEANSEQSKHLNVAKGYPLLRVTQRVMTSNDSLVYCNEQFIRSDSYKYVVKR